MNAQIKEFTTRLENEFPEEASRLAQFGDQVTLATEIEVPLYLPETTLSEYFSVSVLYSLRYIMRYRHVSKTQERLLNFSFIQHQSRGFGICYAE